MVLANIDGKPLTDPAFAPIWSAIDARALPVLVHPTAPPGVDEMDMVRFQLTASLGFTFDTSLAIARMIYDGFFDRIRSCRSSPRTAAARCRTSSRGWTSATTTSRRAARRSRSGRRNTCRGSAPTRSSSRPKCSISRQGVRRRQRAVRLRLSAHDRRHAGLPEARERIARRRARQGARAQRAARVRAVAASSRARVLRGECGGPAGLHTPCARRPSALPAKSTWRASTIADAA